MRVRLDIAYDGTDFHGWARQPDQRTVCGELERALFTLFRFTPTLTVAGRTDAGVHATGQVAHLDLPPATQLSRELKLLGRRLARLLPTDVRVTSIRHVPPEFNARFSALRRHYIYRIGTAPWGVPPLRARDTVHHPPRSGRPLDVDAMNRASERLLGLRDFTAYCRARPDATTVRELQRFRWARHGDDLLVAEVSADAFCWSMVRSLVGALLAVGDGQRDLDWPFEILSSQGRCQGINVAPARGLCLTAVDYPAEGDLAERNEQTAALREPIEGPQIRESEQLTAPTKFTYPDN